MQLCVGNPTTQNELQERFIIHIEITLNIQLSTVQPLINNS